MTLKSLSLSLLLGTLTLGCASTPKNFPEDPGAFKKAFPSAFSKGKKNLSCDIIVQNFLEKNNSPYLEKLNSAEKKYLDALSFKMKIDFEEDEFTPIKLEKKEGVPLPFDPMATWASGGSEQSITLKAIKIAENDIKSIGSALTMTYLKNFTDWKTEAEKSLASGGYQFVNNDTAESVLVKENLKSFQMSYRGNDFSGKNSELTADYDEGAFPVPYDISEKIEYRRTIYMRYFLNFDKSTTPPTLKSVEAREANFIGYSYDFKNCQWK